MSNLHPQVSIIVPVYKAEKYIRACVESILQQTFTDFELILVDDGSPDESGKIIDELAEKDSRIRVFHQQNAGPGAARNLGLENAKGDFINFVDADDCLEQAFLESYQKVNAAYECVFQGYTKLSDAGKCERVYCAKASTKSNSFEDICITLLESELLGYMWLKQFRRSIIEEYHIRFDNNIKYREDFLFTIQYLSFCRKVCITEDAGYLYRVDNPNSLLHTWWDAEEFLKTNDRVYEIVAKAWEDYGKLHRYFIQWYADNQYKGIRGLVRSCNRKKERNPKELEYIRHLVDFRKSMKTNIIYATNRIHNVLLKLTWESGNSRLIHWFMRTTIR